MPKVEYGHGLVVDWDDRQWSIIEQARERRVEERAAAAQKIEDDKEKYNARRRKGAK
jgi:hypothetical protein